MKSTLFILLISFFCLSQAALADTTKVEDFSVVIDQQHITLSESAIKADNKLFVPLRSFLSLFGAEISWKSENNSILIKADGQEYQLPVDTKNLSITYEESNIPIKLVEDQIYIPTDLVKKILNFNFSWNENNATLSAVKIPEATTVFKDLPKPPQYTVMETITGIASWYGGEFNGRKTNSGEIFDENALTAAHRTLPFGTYLKVTFLETNKSTVVRVNDRGPHVKGRVLDLSKKAAEVIGLKPHGLGEVKIEVLENYSE